MKQIYADNAATTKMSKKAVAAMLPFLEENYGNPSSLHTAGQIAKKAITNARGEIANCLGAKMSEIVFTSGGSEADNQAIMTGAEYGRQNGKMHIISQKTEHHAVLHTLKKLEQQGFEITLLDVDAFGMVTAEQVKNAIREDTALVTIMMANNEIGTIMPIKDIGKVCREKGVLFHTDAVQAVGHIPINVRNIGCDMLSFSAHKFHGAKGVGALYIKSKLTPYCLIEGGEQESGRRAGTENVAGIVAMAAALQESVENMKEKSKKITEIRNRIIGGLWEINNSVLNGSKARRLPNNISFCFKGIQGEALLLLLDTYGICVSSGSACTSGSLEPSHVLTAIGRKEDMIYGSLRISISEETTIEDADYIIDSVQECVEKLRKMSPTLKNKD